MKTCAEDCIPACDFCRHYDFNGDEEGRYIGEGICNLHNIGRHPGEECEDFHCRAVPDDPVIGK